MTPKRKKICGVVLLAVISGVVAYGLLKRKDEPKYQGRYLSEWLDKSQRWKVEYWQAGERSDTEVEVAVRNISTNALPYLVKWLTYKTPAWRINLRKKLPAFITTRAPFAGWLGGDAERRRNRAYVGLMILGTNAVSALPELQARLKSAPNPDDAFPAQYALSIIGLPAIPDLKTALADPNHPNRQVIIYVLRDMAWLHGTNVGLPILMEALNDDDIKVRSAATNAIFANAPHLLTNAPAK